MKLLRHVQTFCYLIPLVTYGSLAVTPLQALMSYPELSTLTSLVNASTNFTILLANSNDFTFLAPSNDAFAAFASQNQNLSNKALIEATLQYSLLRGGYPTLSFSNTSQFVATNLINGSYANVTGGQRVELVLAADGTPQVITGNRSISTSTSNDIISVGGIIHIVNEVIAVPVTAVLEITAAGLEYFISILNTAGYLSNGDTYVNEVLDLPDITYFIPNSAAALAKANTLAQNSTPAELKEVFQYHVIPGFVAYGPDLTDGMQLKTALGSNVTITVQNGETYVNAAKITSFDYLVANGVFHIIDDLLNQNDTSPPPKPTTSTSTSTSSSPTSTASPTPAPTENTAMTTTPAQSQNSKGLTTGAKAGIGVGAAVGALLVIAAVVWFLLRSKKDNGESMVWDEPSMSGSPNDTGKYYVQGGTAQRQEFAGTGFRGLHSIQTGHMEDMDSKNAGLYGMATSTPTVPPRSPSRLGGNQFF